MELNIEPKLKAALESHVAIARATFAPDVHPFQIMTSCLLYYIGYDLAKVDKAENGQPVWVGTEKLTTMKPVDILAFHPEGPEKTTIKPPIAPSLKILINKFVLETKTFPAKNVSETTEAVALLAWASLELAVFMADDSGEELWRPSTDFYGADIWKSFYDFPSFQRWLRDQFRKPRMCSELAGIARGMRELTAARLFAVSTPETI